MASATRTLAARFTGDATGLAKAAGEADKALAATGRAADGAAASTKAAMDRQTADVDQAATATTKATAKVTGAFASMTANMAGSLAGGVVTSFTADVVGMPKQVATAMGNMTEQVTSSLAATATSFVTERAAKLANIVATNATALASKAYAAAQWLVNAALNANPIGLVILALTALAVGFKYAWDNSETFRRVVTAAWDGIKNAASAAWTWTRTKAIDPLVGGFQGVWDKAGQVRDGVAGIWDGLARTTSNAFAAMVEGIKTPFRTVFGWINANVISNLNRVTSVFGLEVPSLPSGFARGGLARGPGGPTGDKIPAFLSDHEFVTRSQSTRRMQRRHPGWLEHVNRYGTPPGFAGGGLVDRVKGAVDFVAGSVSGAVSGIIDAVTDPVGFVTKMIRGSLAGLGGGLVGTVMTKLVGTLLDRAAAWITDRNTPPGGAAFAGGVPAGTGAWAAPLAGYTVTAGFPRYPSGRSHTGIDLAAGAGTPIYAAGPGRVASVQHLATSYGNHVRVDHGGGLQTLYAHMQRTGATPGQTVAARTPIGTVDSTGNSTGDHLHFEVRRGGAIDPRAFMRSVGVALAGGGIVTRPTVALMGEAGREAVIPLPAGDLGARTYTINVTVERGASTAEAGRAVVEQIRAFERAAGRSWRAA